MDLLHLWFRICSSFQLNIYYIVMLVGLIFHLRLKYPLTSTLYFLCPFRLSCIPTPDSLGRGTAFRAQPAAFSPALSSPPAQGPEDQDPKCFLFWKPLPPARPESAPSKDSFEHNETLLSEDGAFRFSAMALFFYLFFLLLWNYESRDQLWL